MTRLREACKRTCELDVHLHFGFDSDDPFLQDNILAAGDALFTTGDRMHLAGWTNLLATYHPKAPYLASIGDDMVPVTPGWDRLLVEAQQRYGPGFTYPDDKRRHDIPEAVVIDARITAALGWVCEPTLTHWYVDNVWADLGNGAGCLTYVPAAVVEHRHPNIPGGDKPDGTYNDAARCYNHDLTRYQSWRLRRMRADVSAVRGVREALPDPQ